MHLITDPWIPTNTEAPMGLAQALKQAHRVTLGAQGPERTALLRVLTVVAARLTGLDSHTDRQTWAAHRARLLSEGRFDPEQVDAYLHSQADRFHLFDSSRPWMQDPRLAKECPKRSGIWKLAWGRGSLERPSHFNKNTTAPVPTPQAALHLLTQLLFGAGGRVSARAHANIRAAHSGMGPLRGSVSYHPSTGDLFADLVCGMPYVPRTGDDLAPWETELNDPLDPVPAPTGLATTVLGSFRHALLLVPDETGQNVVDAYVTWGAQAPDERVRDPWLIEKPKKAKKGEEAAGSFIPLAQADRASWRDLPLLLDPETAPPVWSQLADDATDLLLLPEGMGVKLCGFDQDRGQTRDHQYIDGTIHSVDRVLTDEAHRRHRLARIADFEEAATALVKACTTMARHLRMRAHTKQAEMLMNFWLEPDRSFSDRTAKDIALQMWDYEHEGSRDQRRLGAAMLGRQHLERLTPTPEQDLQDLSPQQAPAPTSQAVHA